VFVALEARSPCFLCGYQYRVIRFSQVRVNKNSLRETGAPLISAGQRRCPECGERNVGDLIPVSAYRLVPKDAAKVAACRERKWGITGTGALPLVEARRVA
jgi:hypothetical protein